MGSDFQLTDSDEPWFGINILEEFSKQMLFLSMQLFNTSAFQGLSLLPLVSSVGFWKLEIIIWIGKWFVFQSQLQVKISFGRSMQ